MTPYCNGVVRANPSAGYPGTIDYVESQHCFIVINGNNFLCDVVGFIRYIIL